jgi:hypothetical protein
MIFSIYFYLIIVVIDAVLFLLLAFYFKVDDSIDICDFPKVFICFSDLSYKLTNNFSKDIKKNNGIYFTPPDTVSNTIDIIQEYSKYTNEWSGNILEPSCGSCEYVNELCKRFPKSQIKAIEYNKVIYENIEEQ